LPLQPGIEGAIRVGDCFAMLVEFHYEQRQYREAYHLITVHYSTRQSTWFRILRSSPLTDALRVRVQPGIEGAIRVGDCFAMLVEFHYEQRQYREAYHLIEKMRERRIILHPYLEHDIVVDIHRSLGIPLEPEAAADFDEVRHMASTFFFFFFSPL
jgi:hypothetical protein